MGILKIKSRIEIFLQHAWESKSWILASMLALSAVGYTTHFVFTFSSEYGKELQNTIVFDENIAESNRIALIYQLILEANKKNILSLNFYSDHLANKKWSEHIDDEVIKQGFETSTIAIKTLSYVCSTLKGIRLHDEILDSYRQQFYEGFSELEAVHSVFIKLYIAHGLHDEASKKSLISELNDARFKSDKIAFHLIETSQNYAERVSTVMKMESIDVSTAISEIKMLNISFLLALFSFLYLIGYTIAVIMAITSISDEQIKKLIKKR